MRAFHVEKLVIIIAFSWPAFNLAPLASWLLGGIFRIFTAKAQRRQVRKEDEKGYNYPMPEILIIEDDRDISENLEYNLKKEGFKVARSFDGINGLRLAKEKHPALIILDLMLPGLDGLEVCRQIRKIAEISSTPIIMLTAKGEETDKVVGLEVGADDYLTKPFSLKELMARIKTILRRSGRTVEAPKPHFKFKELEIDADRHEIKVAGKPIELTAKEFGLLQYLMENPGRVFSRETLLDKVWGIDVAIETRTVDVHMRRLREKLGKAGKYLVTLRGVGYKFKE